MKRWNSKTIPRLPFIIFNMTVVIIIYLLIITPITTFYSNQTNEIMDLAQKLARFRSLADQEAAVANLVKSFDESKQAVTFLTGKDEGAASANLQAKLKELIEASNLRIHSIQGIELKVVNNLRLIGAHISMEGENSAIYQALDAIEKNTPPLFVTSLTIRSPAETADLAQVHETSLSAQLDVYGAINATPASN